MRKHQKQFAEDERRGKLTRDSFLKRQDVRNLEHKLAETVWKWHGDEAASVQHFKDHHAKNVFINREQRTAQPAADSQPSQAAQPFVMGLLSDAFKYGHNNVVCIDAAFARNHLKFPLYTALVVDAPRCPANETNVRQVVYTL